MSSKSSWACIVCCGVAFGVGQQAGADGQVAPPATAFDNTVAAKKPFRFLPKIKNWVAGPEQRAATGAPPTANVAPAAPVTATPGVVAEPIVSPSNRVPQRPTYAFEPSPGANLPTPAGRPAANGFATSPAAPTVRPPAATTPGTQPSMLRPFSEARTIPIATLPEKQPSNIVPVSANEPAPVRTGRPVPAVAVPTTETFEPSSSEIRPRTPNRPAKPAADPEVGVEMDEPTTRDFDPPPAKNRRADNHNPPEQSSNRNVAEPPTKSQNAVAVPKSSQKPGEQTLTLDWLGPQQIQVGEPFDYELVVRNVGASPVNNVVVRDWFPEGIKVLNVEPAGVQNQGGYSWNLEALGPSQERRIRIEMVAETKGEIVCHATVTATSPAVARLQVRQPQLEVRQVSPQRVTVGDPIAVNIEIANIGDGIAKDVTLHARLPDGLRHPRGSNLSYKIGSLNAGESRRVELGCEALKGGAIKIHTNATANGGLRADANSTTVVSESKLEITVSGPRLRYLDRQATYTIIANNPGDAPAQNVQVVANLPTGFKYMASSHGGQHDPARRSVRWTIPDLAPNEEKRLSYMCVAVEPGQQRHAAQIAADHTTSSTADTVTLVEGVAALIMEIVDIDDPVEVGADTAYEIRITNQGSSEATNVQIHATIPKELQVRGSQGPTEFKVQGQEVIFDALPKLAPRADVVYRVFVRGAAVGDARFRARLTSDSLSDQVITEHSTKVYEGL